MPALLHINPLKPSLAASPKLLSTGPQPVTFAPAPWASLQKAPPPQKWNLAELKPSKALSSLRSTPVATSLGPGPKENYHTAHLAPALNQLVHGPTAFTNPLITAHTANSTNLHGSKAGEHIAPAEVANTAQQANIGSSAKNDSWERISSIFDFLGEPGHSWLQQSLPAQQLKPSYPKKNMRIALSPENFLQPRFSSPDTPKPSAALQASGVLKALSDAQVPRTSRIDLRDRLSMRSEPAAAMRHGPNTFARLVNVLHDKLNRKSDGHEPSLALSGSMHSSSEHIAAWPPLTKKSANWQIVATSPKVEDSSVIGSFHEADSENLANLSRRSQSFDLIDFSSNTTDHIEAVNASAFSSSRSEHAAQTSADSNHLRQTPLRDFHSPPPQRTAMSTASRNRTYGAAEASRKPLVFFTYQLACSPHIKIAQTQQS